MDVIAIEKTTVKRKPNENAAAFKTNPTNTIIGGTKKRISSYFASSCTASFSIQTKVLGSVNKTGQKGFIPKLQPSIAQLLDPKISIFEAPKNIEEWSQNHAFEMVLAGINKNISQAATVFNYDCRMQGVQGYHQAYLGHFLINGKKTPPPKVKVNDQNIAKIEHGILEAYEDMNSSS